MTVRAGDFVHVPAWTVHRESNPTREPSLAVIARVGGGKFTTNPGPVWPETIGILLGARVTRFERRFEDGWRPVRRRAIPDAQRPLLGSAS